MSDSELISANDQAIVSTQSDDVVKDLENDLAGMKINEVGLPPPAAGGSESIGVLESRKTVEFSDPIQATPSETESSTEPAQPISPALQVVESEQSIPTQPQSEPEPTQPPAADEKATELAKESSPAVQPTDQVEPAAQISSEKHQTSVEAQAPSVQEGESNIELVNESTAAADESKEAAEKKIEEPAAAAANDNPETGKTPKTPGQKKFSFCKMS